MTEWRTVFGTETEKPAEFDTSSSPSTIYQRRNITEETQTDEDGNEVKGWRRDEREMTPDEYNQIRLVGEVVAENTAGIVKSVTEFQSEAVIDEYTMQLIEEGIL